MFMLTGRVALVTGASRGIGRAIALSLAAGGAHVVAAARGDNAKATVEAILAAGGSAEVATLDVTDPASVDAVVAGVLERHKRIDVLVNNAGVTKDQLMLRMKRDDWDGVIAANLTGAYTCVQAVLKSMVRARQGRIISITSVVGEAGNAGQANYAASKAGIIGVSKSLAQEVASRGVRVNAIAPGYIATDMTDAIPESAKEKLMDHIPLKRLGTAEDIAGAALFLASDDSKYITGQVLAVDGGMFI